jgi:hypothetical protein
MTPTLELEAPILLLSPLLPLLPCPAHQANLPSWKLTIEGLKLSFGQLWNWSNLRSIDLTRAKSYSGHAWLFAQLDLKVGPDVLCHPIQQNNVPCL